MFHVPNKFRYHKGPMASEDDARNNGAFILPALVADRHLIIIASDGMDWEHVSVHIALNSGKTRIRTWEEMCQVKNLFWDSEDAVMQLHPPQSTWVNNHRTTLHLWRPLKVDIPLPPEVCVGYKELGTIGG